MPSSLSLKTTIRSKYSHFIVLTPSSNQHLASLMNCHPERSEGPAVRWQKQVLRFAQDDKL
jgi:hypothetical protein